MGFSRRTVLKASAATAILGSVGAPVVARAEKAESTYKYANNLPDSHPLNVRAKEMSAAIKTETNGRVDVQIFPSNQLGSDTDMLSQIRSGSGHAGSGGIDQRHRFRVSRLRHGLEGHGWRTRRVCPWRA